MAYVQKVSASADAVGSIAPALTGVVAGNTLALIVGATNNSIGAAARAVPTDSSGQTWLSAVAPVSVGATSGDQSQAAIYYLLNANAGTHTVTFSLPPGSQYCGYTLVEFAACSAVDVTTSNGGTSSGTTGNTGTTATTTQANDVSLICVTTNTTGAGLASSAITDPPSGYTSLFAQQDTTAHTGAQHGYQELSATGTQSATWTWSSGTQTSWQAVIATFKLSGGSSGPVGLATETDTALALAPAGPVITGTATATPANGSSLTVTGSAFGASQGTKEVRIGGVAQPVSSWAAGSITVSSVTRGANKYGVALNVEIWDSGALISNSFALTGLIPQTGWSYIDLSTPNTSAANRITTTPDLASGDQVAYDDVGGKVTVANDATFSAGASVTAFDFEVWSSPEGWGFAATQYLLGQPLTDRGLYAARVVAEAARRRRSSAHALGPANWGGVPLNVEKWFAPELTAAAGGASGAVGTAAETDTALPRGSARPAGVCTEADTALARTAVQVRGAGLSTEADSSLALTPSQIRTTGLATEADTALALAGVQIKAVGLAAEADTALARSAVQMLVAGLGVETDAALALLPGANGAVGLAIEADTALPRGVARPAGQSVEADTALALGGVAIRAVGMSVETDSALQRGSARPATLAAETDTALALTANVNGAVGTAVETDLALPRGSARPPGLGVETELALALAPAQIRVTGLALEVDSAIALSAAAGSSAGLASETDTALPRGSARPAGRAAETDAALGLAATLIRAAGQAAEADVAFALAGIARRAVGLSVETDTALQLFTPGAQPAGRAQETDTAIALQAAAIPQGRRSTANAYAQTPRTPSTTLSRRQSPTLRRK